MHYTGSIRHYHNIVSRTDNRVPPWPVPDHLSCHFHHNPLLLQCLLPFRQPLRHRQRSGYQHLQKTHLEYTLPSPDIRPTCPMNYPNIYRELQSSFLPLSRKSLNGHTEKRRLTPASHTKLAHNNPYTPEFLCQSYTLRSHPYQQSHQR